MRNFEDKLNAIKKKYIEIEKDLSQQDGIDPVKLVKLNKEYSELTTIDDEDEKMKIDTKKETLVSDTPIKPITPDNAVSANVAGELTKDANDKTPITIPMQKNVEKPGLSFNNIDSAIGVNKKVEEINAPKDIHTLEEISEFRNNQRKEEEELEEDDSIKIHDSSVPLNGLDVQVLDKSIETKKDPILTDIEVLT